MGISKFYDESHRSGWFTCKSATFNRSVLGRKHTTNLAEKFGGGEGVVGEGMTEEGRMEGIIGDYF